MERGYYFTFVSIVGVYSILDLGLGQTLLVIFSREQSKLINSNAVRKILFVTRIYYKYLSLIFVILSLIIGSLFFNNTSGTNVNWSGPWILTSISTGILLLNSAKLIFLEASGKLASVALMRTKQTILANITLLLLLYFGFGLWSFSIYQFFLAIFSSYFIYFDKVSIIYRKGRKINKKPKFIDSFQIWKYQIFPLQWKISINYLCGIIIFQLITPFIFSSLGPVKAGLVGLNLNITNAIIVISSSFISASIPKLGGYIENNQEIIAYKSFKQLTKQSLFFGVLLLSVGFFLSFNFHSKYPNIFLEPNITFFIALTAICHILIFNIASYFRIYKKELLIPHSIFSAICHIILYSQVSNISIRDLFLNIFAINFVTLILTLRTYRIFRSERLKV